MDAKINEKKQIVVAKFADISDKDERLRAIIEMGRKLPQMEDSLKIEPFLVRGCISRAWLAPRKGDSGQIFFEADSEAMIVKGIIAVLLEVYSGATAAEIEATDPSFLAEIGISEHLSMNRRNGLANIVKTIQNYAKALKNS